MSYLIGGTEIPNPEFNIYNMEQEEIKNIYGLKIQNYFNSDILGSQKQHQVPLQYEYDYLEILELLYKFYIENNFSIVILFTTFTFITNNWTEKIKFNNIIQDSNFLEIKNIQDLLNFIKNYNSNIDIKNQYPGFYQFILENKEQASQETIKLDNIIQFFLSYLSANFIFNDTEIRIEIVYNETEPDLTEETKKKQQQDNDYFFNNNNYTIEEDGSIFNTLSKTYILGGPKND